MRHTVRMIYRAPDEDGYLVDITRSVGYDVRSSAEDTARRWITQALADGLADIDVTIERRQDDGTLVAIDTVPLTDPAPVDRSIAAARQALHR